MQLAYTPCVASLIVQSLAAIPHANESLGPLSVEPAETMPLYLPSSLPQRLRQLPELAILLGKECRLRVAQADDALAEIRRQRRIISGLWQFKKLNVDGTGNKACTRMRTLYNRFNLRTQRCAACYRAARSALLVLDPDGSWWSRLNNLKDADIRGPGRDDNGSGNGRFEPSWIWLVPRVHSAPDMGDSEIVLNNSLQVEWAKTQARKQRWEEEVLLIQEEMRRVVKFHEWKAQWWQGQAGRCSGNDGSIIHGISAYAEKQAHFCECLAQSCVATWLPTLKENGVVPDDWKAIPATVDTSFVNEGENDAEIEGTEKVDDCENEGEQYSEGDNTLYMDHFELDD